MMTMMTMMMMMMMMIDGDVNGGIAVTSDYVLYCSFKSVSKLN